MTSSRRPEVALSDVAAINPHQVPPKDRVGSLRYIDLASVSADRGIRDEDIRELDWEDAPGRARRSVQTGDVLVATVRPYLRGFGVVAQHHDGAVASTGFAVVRANPDALDPAFAWVIVRSGAFMRHLVARQTGSNYPAVRAADVAGYRFNLPPLDEQRAIAAAVASADALVSTAMQYGDAAETALRAAVHHLVVPEGTWDVLPAGWAIASLGELADVRSGVTKGRKVKAPTTPQPFLRAANVQDGRLDLDEIHTIDVTDDEVERFRLQVGDVLMLEGGNRDDVGRGWIWNGEVPGCLHQNHVFRARVHDSRVLPLFLAYVVTSQPARAFCLTRARQTSNLATLNKTNASALPVPVPPLDVQEAIIGQLDALRNVRDAARSYEASARTTVTTLIERFVSAEADAPETPHTADLALA